MKVSAGTTFKISAGVPATFDAAGYAALSYTTVGDIENYAEFGAEWANESKRPVAIKGAIKRKTSRDDGNFTLALALDTDDAGQILMKAARESVEPYACLVTTPNGDKYYCQGLVNTFKVNPAGQGSKLTASTAIAVTSSSTDVGWVEVMAP